MTNPHLQKSFISILVGTDLDFPLHLWDKIIPKDCIAINLLRNSHTDPQLLAEAHLNGKLNYNTMPLYPHGTKVVAFEPPDTCNSWATHGTLG